MIREKQITIIKMRTKVKIKIWLDFQESVFLQNLGGKYFPEVMKNLEMSLFADYIKFDPQTFDCYI